MSGSEEQFSTVRVLKTRFVEHEQQAETLNLGGGDGTLPPMELVDAKIAAAEARTDTKFAELRGDLSKFATKGTVWGAMGTALGVVLAVLAFAANRFDAGMTTQGAISAVMTEQHKRDDAQDQKLDEILKRLPVPKPAAGVTHP